MSLKETTWDPQSWTLADQIIQQIAEKHGVTVEALKGRSRRGSIRAARKDAVRLIYKHTELSTPEIGELFNRDHTTIVHLLTYDNAERGEK